MPDNRDERPLTPKEIRQLADDLAMTRRDLQRTLDLAMQLTTHITDLVVTLLRAIGR